MKKVIVIGSGFSGLSAATALASKGYGVKILEKNNIPGGRARIFEADGFTFDMGPSWYWMPDVFEDYFNRFGYSTSDFYELRRLNPSYRIYFSENEAMDVPAGLDDIYRLFETKEPGSASKLEKFLSDAKYKYEVGMKEFVRKPGLSVLEFVDIRIARSMFRLQMFSSLASEVRKLFKNQQLVSLLEFPVLFLGATPEKTPAMYSLMNYADMVLGTWYPMGGMFKIVEAMVAVAESFGVEIVTSSEVREIAIEDGRVVGVQSDSGFYATDIVVGAADYHHVEQKLIPKKYRQYNPEYWATRVMAPSSLLFYLGIDKRLVNLRHHNLFFDKDFRKHASEIYEERVWPSDPLFYVCAPSITDPSVAPDGCENLFVLIPVATDLNDDDSLRNHYYNLIMERLENLTGQSIGNHVVYQKSYAHSDFIRDYHAYKGNAYGLANTLWQTAFLKPKMKSQKVEGLYYTGQLTTPGPGVPPALISGQVVADLVAKDHPISSAKLTLKNKFSTTQS